MPYRVWGVKNIGGQLAEFVLLGEMSNSEFARLDKVMEPLKALIELWAAIQEFEEAYEFFAGVAGSTLGPDLNDPLVSSEVRRAAEDHLIRIVIFSNALSALLGRLDREAGKRLKKQIKETGQQDRALTLVRAMLWRRSFPSMRQMGASCG